MTVTLDLKPETETRLRHKAEKAGQSLPDYLLTVVDADAEDEGMPVGEGSAFDLFDGLLGKVAGSGEGHWSEDTGRKFAEGMAEKRRQGHL